jgi:hypothetical protein
MEALAPSRQARRSAGRLTFTQRPAIIEAAALTRMRQSGGLRRVRTVQLVTPTNNACGRCLRCDVIDCDGFHKLSDSYRHAGARQCSGNTRPAILHIDFAAVKTLLEGVTRD